MINAAGKWSDFEDALALLMGCQPAAATRGGHLYQMLVNPSFHTPCCLTLDDRGHSIEATLVLLLSQHDLFPRVWQGGGAPVVPPSAWANRRCWQDIVELAAPQQALFRDLCIRVDLTSLA